MQSPHTPEQAKRFGRVSAFVMIPEPPPRWHRPVAVLVGGLVGGGFGLVGGWVASACFALTLLGLAVSRWRARRKAREAWTGWADAFQERLPALLEELAGLPTSYRLYLAGLAVGTRLGREPIPEVPAREVARSCPRDERLVRWLSDQCASVPSPFHRGLQEALTERNPRSTQS